MERNSPSDIIHSLLSSLKNGEQTLSQLSKSSGINRVTASQYITAFEKGGVVEIKTAGREKLISLKNSEDTYFNLPIKEQEKKVMHTIYSLIRTYCNQTYGKNPAKTHVYKIIYDVMKEKKLNLPVGWYQHGPCAVLIYSGNEESEIKLDYETLIKEKVEQYCKLEPIDLQKDIYKKYDSKLYNIKEDIKSGKEIDPLELLKVVPKETLDLVTDFARATMLLGWEKTRSIFFSSLWKYISLVNFKESLRIYYGDEIEEYLKDKIKERKQEAEEQLDQVIFEYTDAKYSQDELYQRWVKQKK
jgi:hypothetical protein